MFSKKVERFDISSAQTTGSGMFSVVTDKETQVQYLVVIYPNMGSGMSVLVNKDGKPLLKRD